MSAAPLEASPGYVLELDIPGLPPINTAQSMHWSERRRKRQEWEWLTRAAIGDRAGGDRSAGAPLGAGAAWRGPDADRRAGGGAVTQGAPISPADVPLEHGCTLELRDGELYLLEVGTPSWLLACFWWRGPRAVEAP